MPWPLPALKNSSKRSSKGAPGAQPGGRLGPSSRALRFASTVCVAEMLTTASETWAERSASESGPLACAGATQPAETVARSRGSAHRRRDEVRTSCVTVSCRGTSDFIALRLRAAAANSHARSALSNSQVFRRAVRSARFRLPVRRRRLSAAALASGARAKKRKNSERGLIKKRVSPGLKAAS